MNRIPAPARFVSRCLVLLLCLALPALAFAAKLPEVKAPEPGMAVLNGEHQLVKSWGVNSAVGVRIGVLDGDSRRTGLFPTSIPASVQVTPGRHTVRLEYIGSGVAQGHFWFDAEAGKAYTARFDTMGMKVRMWIEETDTGLPVGGVGDGKDEGQVTGPVEAEAAATSEAASPPVTAPPPAPDATTAILVSDPGNGPKSVWSTWDSKTLDRQEIDSVDGKRQRHKSNDLQSVRLAPGAHTVVIEYKKSTMVMSRKLAFTAEANKTYWIRRLTENYAVQFWIEETGSGTRVSEEIR